MALVLAMVVVFAMGITVFASEPTGGDTGSSDSGSSATTYTLTIKSTATATSTQTNATEYHWYKMLEADIASLAEVNMGTATMADGSLKDDSGKVAYYVENETLANALAGTGKFTVTRVGTTDHWNVTSTSSASEIATALNSINANAIANGTATASGTSDTEISGLTPGYYLVTSTNGTVLVVQTLGDVTIYEKNYYPTNTKTEDKQNAEIGEAVTYTVTVDIPESIAEKKITIVDTISDGLTLNTTATVSGAVASPAYTSATFVKNNSFSTEGYNQYTIEIPAATVIANKSRTLTFTYTANVNENAVVDEPEDNKAHIEYDEYVTKDIEVQVKTFGFELEKVDKDNHNIKLEGVTFTLVNGDSKYYTPGTNSESVDEARFLTAENTVATGSDGKITFAGLHAGTYTLTEIDNPNVGYNMLTAPVTITVAADGTITTGDGATVASKLVTIENGKGAELPSTGGIGTTLFYIIGAVIVAGAVVLLVARRKVNAER